MNASRPLILAALLALGGCGAASAQRDGDHPRGAKAVAASAAALTDLTPENAVLVYVDFNTGLDNLGTSVPGAQYRSNVQAFAEFARIFRMPTAVFGEANDFYGPFYPEIQRLIDAGAPNFHRTTPSGFTPQFADWLKKSGRKNIIIGGLSIDNCTLHTSLDLLRNGYNVFFLPDVSPTNNPLAHEAAVERLTAAGAVPITWVTAATDLVGDWNSPHGKQLMPVMQARLRPATVGTPTDPTPDGKGF
jgi:nicotinamidase-related amidase